VIIAACLCALVGSFPVEDPDSAGVMDELPKDIFTRVDKDKDDKLSFDEYLHSDALFVQLKREEFNNLDADHDGTLSKFEYESHFQKEKEATSDLKAEYFGKIFEEFDENFDLKLDEGEIINVMAKRFMLAPKAGVNISDIVGRFDTNHDGGIDLAEYMKLDREYPFYMMEPINSPSADGEREHAPLVESLPEDHPILAFKTEKLPLMKQSISEKLI